MKQILILLLTIPFISLGQDLTTNDFTGKWTGTEKDEVGSIIFDTDGYVLIEINGQVFGGKEFLINDGKASMTYEIDTQKNPMTLDFISTNLSTNEQRKLLCIAEFIDSKQIRFASDFTDIRPKEFTEKNAIILTKVE